jgi:DNA replication protein DnaC
MSDDQNQAADFLANLDAMIAAAPDDEETPTIEQNSPATPVLGVNRHNTPLHGFPDRHGRDLTLYGDEWRAAYEKALAIAESGGFIVAYGRRGTGKTQIAFEIARNARFQNPCAPKKEWVMKHDPKYREALYFKAMDIFIDLKNGFSRPKEPSEKEVIARLVEAVFLVIDEAHVRGETKYEDDKLTHILDKRYDAMRATMLITNLEKKDFAAQLSPSVLNRMIEIGGGIECNWQSYRTKPTNNTNEK